MELEDSTGFILRLMEEGSLLAEHRSVSHIAMVKSAYFLMALLENQEFSFPLRVEEALKELNARTKTKGHAYPLIAALIKELNAGVGTITGRRLVGDEKSAGHVEYKFLHFLKKIQENNRRGPFLGKNEF